MKKKMLLLFIGLMVPFAANSLRRAQLIEAGYKKAVAYKQVYTGTTVKIGGTNYAFNDITSKRLSEYLQSKTAILDSSNFEKIVLEATAVLEKRGINYKLALGKTRTVKDTFNFVKAAFDIASTSKQKELMKKLLQVVSTNFRRPPYNTGPAHTDGATLENSIKAATGYGAIRSPRDIETLTETIYPEYGIGEYRRGPAAPGAAMEMYAIVGGRSRPYKDLNDNNLSSYLGEQKDKIMATGYASTVAKIAHVLDLRGIDDKIPYTTHNNTFAAVEKAVTVYEGMEDPPATATDKEALKKLLIASQNNNKRITPRRTGGSDIVASGSGGKALYNCFSGWSVSGNKKRKNLKKWYGKYL